jgi:hypothetical protein
MGTFRDLDPRFQPYARYLYDYAQWLGVRPRITSTYRSISHQRRLYNEYQRGERSLPVAKPGCSQHNYRLAFDMVSDDNEELGAEWRSLGGYWGGPKDPVHFGVPWFPCS